MKTTYLVLPVSLCLWAGAAMGQFKVLLNLNGTNGATPLYSSPFLYNNQLICPGTSGGAIDSGTVFSIDTSGSGYNDLHDFTGATGRLPTGALIASGNVLYGTTGLGGKYDSGCVYSIHPDGSGYKDLFDFAGPNGNEPLSQLTLIGNKLYGTTVFGGALGKGVIFSVDTDGTNYSDLHDFLGTNGATPLTSLYLSGSALYGVTLYGGAHDSGCIFSIQTNGAMYKDIYDFTGANGREPAGGVIVSQGIIYAAAALGGPLEQGCIFAVDSDGSNYIDLHDFTNSTGSVCFGPLVLKGDMLFGVCAGGGAKDSGCIFSIKSDGGSYRDLFDFDHTGYPGETDDGIIISGETVYGIASGGGTNGLGVVYSYTNPLLAVSSIKPIAGDISVYPNPGNGNFVVALGHAGLVSASQPIIEVYNALGQQVFSAALNQTQGNNSIDLSNQPDGVYLYRVMSLSGNLIGQGKLVIQK